MKLTASNYPNLTNIFLLESKTEVLRLIRTPSFTIPTLLFPIMFYIFFGIVFSMDPTSMPTYLMVTYGVFGIMSPAFFAFGVGIAIERGQGWFALKEISPMPFSAYIVSRIVLTFTFSLAIIILLFSIGALFGDVVLLHWQWVTLALILIIGSLPFCAIGMALGLYLKENSAPAVVNLIYLPMGFLSGLWLPINFLPEFMQQFANLLPAYHLAQLSLMVIDKDLGGSALLHIAALVIYTVLFTILSIMAYHKTEKTHES